MNKKNKNKKFFPIEQKNVFFLSQYQSGIWMYVFVCRLSLIIIIMSFVSFILSFSFQKNPFSRIMCSEMLTQCHSTCCKKNKTKTIYIEILYINRKIFLFVCTQILGMECHTHRVFM